MSVVIETTLGDITVDLFLKERPRTCLNFLKLCKMKYYNYSLFHTISRNFIAQTGDPTGSRDGGESIYGLLEGSSRRFFEGEKNPRIKHTTNGLVSFVGNDEGMVGSQFFITLGSELYYLDENHCIFGEVMEGLDVLELLNETICDGDNRPYKDVRITHTVVLDDPFPDLDAMVLPTRSPSPSAERLQGGRIGADEDIDDAEGKTAAEVSELLAEREAKARATILEMVGDLPDAEMAPPENVLFVCKLNPVTTDDDLEIIFSRFGKIKSCEVIRDKKTGDSLQYAFVEFYEQKSCEDAYFKMDNVLIDDRRIHVDFSQSVSKVKWHGKGRGITTYDENGKLSKDFRNDLGKGKYSSASNGSRRNRNESPTNDLRQRNWGRNQSRDRDPIKQENRKDKDVQRRTGDSHRERPRKDDNARHRDDFQDKRKHSSRGRRIDERGGSPQETRARSPRNENKYSSRYNERESSRNYRGDVRDRRVEPSRYSGGDLKRYEENSRRKYNTDEYKHRRDGKVETSSGRHRRRSSKSDDDRRAVAKKNMKKCDSSSDSETTKSKRHKKKKKKRYSSDSD